jgi:ankyrin repeat protein
LYPCINDTPEQILLGRGCDLNTFDYEGMTALHLAAEQGLLLITRHLIEEFNVDPTVMTQSTEGPQGVQLSAMHVAILSNRIDIVEYFCSIPELVQIETSLGDAPIHLACMTSIDCVTLLLEAGANRHAENSEGKSPYKVHNPFAISCIIKFYHTYPSSRLPRKARCMTSQPGFNL